MAREIEMLKTCHSDNIVRYYASFTRGAELWIVMVIMLASMHERPKQYCAVKLSTRAWSVP